MSKVSWEINEIKNGYLITVRGQTPNDSYASHRTFARSISDVLGVLKEQLVENESPKG